MRWIWLLATLLSFIACFTRHTPGAFAFWFFAGIFCAMATALAFAQARIDGSSRPDPLLDYRMHGSDKAEPPP